MVEQQAKISVLQLEKLGCLEEGNPRLKEEELRNTEAPQVVGTLQCSGLWTLPTRKGRVQSINTSRKNEQTDFK